MASFDFIEATNKGYSYAWTNRAVITKLGLYPVLVKFVCLVCVSAFGYEDNLLRSGLLMIPSYFLEGWLIAHLLRMAFYSDIGVNLSGDPSRDERALQDKSKDLLAGTIVYVLLRLIGMALVGSLGVDGAAMSKPPETEQDPSVFMFISAMMVLMLFFWMFRIYFIYIPVTLGYSMREYFMKLAGMASSFYILAAWMLCFLPLMLLTILGFDVIKSLTMVDGGGGPLSLFKFLSHGWRAVMEVITEVITTLVIGQGVVVMMSGQSADDNRRG